MSKITIDRFVVEQALEMLNRINAADEDRDFLTEDDAVCTIMAIDELDAAIRAALDQPQVEQEPAIYPEEAFDMGLEAIPYYTHPQHKREPLTEEQIMQAVRHLYQSDVAAEMGFPDDLYVARAIEAAHGIGE